MKKIAFVIVALLSAMLFCVSCDKDGKDNPEPEPNPIPGPPMIEGLTLKNFPVMDGSTSTDPLVRLAASKLLGYEAAWDQRPGVISWIMTTNLPEDFVGQKLKCTQTHGSFINLIGGGADMIFSARTISADEQAYATEAGVSLIETPIALDALIFMEHKNNRMNSLTHQQLQDIYLAKTKNWNEVGGTNTPMVPFVRNKNSGSQELMESLVMQEPIPDGFYEDHFFDFQMIISMAPVFSAISNEPGGLGYTVYYYKENMIRDYFQVKTLAVNDIYPDKSTIKNRTYPFTTDVYMIIRSDLDRSSMAYKIYELMQAEAGKQLIEESGYVPN